MQGDCFEFFIAVEQFSRRLDQVDDQESERSESNLISCMRFGFEGECEIVSHAN